MELQIPAGTPWNGMQPMKLEIQLHLEFTFMNFAVSLSFLGKKCF